LQAILSCAKYGSGALDADRVDMGKSDTLKLLRHRSFPLLAEAIRASTGAVLNRWMDVVRETMPSADELTLTQLRDDLPYILESIAVAMESQGDDVTQDLKAVSSAHGAVRYHQSYNVSEVLLEYSILRPILLDEISRKLGRTMTTDESIAIDQGIDVSLRRSVMNFVNHLTREIQLSAESQSKYLSFLSHDLRGGLNGVVLMVEVLKRELSTEPRFSRSMEDLEMMRRAILETVNTMDRFLHAERFRKGKVQINPSMLDLKALLSDIRGQFSHQTKEKGVELLESIPSDIRIISDRELLTMIFQNVISNAVKYGKKGKVRVSAEKRDDGIVRISVRDEGPGIAEDKLKRLFAPFTRGETHGQGGVGLGLSIARQAADVLGARLWAESVEGNGATFHLELPREA
jgi:signal transduction histidine kinase